MIPEPVRPSRKSWRLYVTLLVIVCLIVARTLVLDRETPRERDNSEAMEQILEALSSTKLAYSPDLILGTGRAGAAKDDGPAKRRHSGTHQHRTGRADAAKDDLDLFDSAKKTDIAAQWRKLASARTGRAAEWRRLGITLYLFHLSGGLDALRHVTDHFPPLPSTTRNGHIPRGQADPFGHHPVSIPPAQELAMWQGIYGTRALSAAETGRYRAMLAQLRLGWFEDVAAAQLFMKAHQVRLARASAQAADQSVRLMVRLEYLNIIVIVFGVIGLLIVTLIGFANMVQRAAAAPRITPSIFHGPPLTTDSRPAGAVYPSNSSNPPQPSHPSYPGHPSYSSVVGMPPQVAANSVGPANSRVVQFPHTVLLVAFIIYLLSQEGVGLLASLALYPVHARLAELPASTLLRLTQLLQIVAYVPILALPLLVLSRRVRYDPLTGERIGWRRLLAYIGFRTRNPLADIGAGAIGYILVTPAVIVAGLISNWLFARYHTPQNPAALEMLAAQGGLDRFLIFFIASVAAPFAEETFFRGILYSALRSQLGVWGAAALSAAIFAVVHPTLPGGFLPIWAVGMGLALVYEWRQSLLPGMILHGLYNGMITLTIFAVFAR